jgi:hypothetical protein
MKDGDNLADYLASAPTLEDSDSGAVSSAVSAAVSAVASDVVSDADSEGNDSWPQPQDDSEDDQVQGKITIYDQPQVPRAKPEWWSEAWDHFE